MDNKIKILKQEYDLANLEGKTQSDIEKSGKKDLLNIFAAVDSNNNGILESAEISIFKKSIEVLNC